MPLAHRFLSRSDIQSMLTLFHLVVIGILSFLLWKRSAGVPENKMDKLFWPALIIKLSAGIGLGFLYQHYYTTGDTWSFFYEGKKAADAIIEDPGNLFFYFWNEGTNYRPRTHFLVKWVSVFNLIDGNNYWITSLYFSFLSFVSSWILYKTVAKHFVGSRMEAGLAFLFVPSIVFWGSGIIKESLAMAALNILSAYFIAWYFSKTISRMGIITLLLSFWVLWNLKYYWAAVWLAVVLPLITVQILKAKVRWVSEHPKMSWSIMLLMALLMVSIIHPNFYYNRLLLVIFENHNAYLALSSPSDAINFYELQPTVFSLLINSPWALISGIFRPFFLEAGNLLQVCASLENLILMLLSGMALNMARRQLFLFNELHLALIAYIILLSVFLSLSTPNFGSLSRFKVGFTPFLWFVLLSASGVLKIDFFLKRKFF